MPEKLKPDLFTFVAGVAAERNEPLPITCNCGGVITIMPPIQENLGRGRRSIILGEDIMNPNELVVGSTYEAKLMRKNTKHNWDGFLTVTYEGTKDEGTDYQTFLFREDAANENAAKEPWEFFAEDIVKKVRPIKKGQ